VEAGALFELKVDGVGNWKLVKAKVLFGKAAEKEQGWRAAHHAWSSDILFEDEDENDRFRSTTTCHQSPFTGSQGAASI
jgi:hypothetical protein